MYTKEKNAKALSGRGDLSILNPTPNNLEGNTTKLKFPIVCIGASAGGLDAIQKFFMVMPANSGIAFVVIMHMDPNHKSLLPEILQKFTPMQILQVNNNLKVEPNKIYVTPPNCGMSILNGYLFLMEMSPHEFTIDTFLRSLAEDQGINSCCIILSGTGTDGTLGLRAIKSESGLIIVQEEASAKYDGMPRSAIGTGLADVILPIEKMPEYLLEFAIHSVKAPFKEKVLQNEDGQTSLKKILVLIRSCTGHDLSHYKTHTIFRRVEKRMLANKLENISDYLLFLQQNKSEIEVLFNELLIGVTRFFRDADAFEVLKNNLFPEIFKNNTTESQIKIWIPGCSTGEEAYSIAIILQEYMNRVNYHFNVQIFGTDISEEFIAKARFGIYPESIKSDVSQERLNNFFVRKDTKSYQLRKSIREMVIFATHDIVKDPPFTKLDMLCCRNLLIYFDSELQKKVMSSFHYSLKNDGILFLGSSESTFLYPDSFSVLDKKWKIYKKLSKDTFKCPVIDFSHQKLIEPVAKRIVEQTVLPIRQLENVNIIKLLKTVLSQSDLPTCVAIDIKGDIFYIHGNTGLFLEPVQGEACFNILEMARHGLKSGLLKAVNKVKLQRKEIITAGLKIKCNDSYVKIDLIVRPLPDFQTGHTGMMLVIFRECSLSDKRVKKSIPIINNEEKEGLRELEEELAVTREKLQSTTIELEAYNEVLSSANEELQSTNEELQSTNEELETSKEEVQSLNEESNTVNAELQSRIDMLTAVNDDIKNFLDATEIATIFLNISLKIRRFTPKSTEIFPLIETDIGRSISSFASSLIDTDLHLYAVKVLEDLVVREIESESRDGKIFRIKIKPYRTANNVIDGVVITFEDITKLKEFEAQLRSLSSGFEEKLLMMSKVFKDCADPIILESVDGIIFEVNRETVISYGWTKNELVGKPSEELLLPANRAELRKTIEVCRTKGLPIRNVENIRISKSGTHIPVLLTFSPIFDLKGNVSAIATIAKNLIPSEMS